jgi:hypothetical protein
METSRRFLLCTTTEQAESEKVCVVFPGRRFLFLPIFPLTPPPLRNSSSPSSKYVLPLPFGRFGRAVSRSNSAVDETRRIERNLSREERPHCPPGAGDGVGVYASLSVPVDAAEESAGGVSQHVVCAAAEMVPDTTAAIHSHPPVTPLCRRERVGQDF